jgi:DHA2 family multidrug resistance protein
VNVPFAIAVIAGLLVFMPSAVNRPRKFDLFGFAMLATFIAATQLLLDRGEGQGWLDSTEIALYLGAAVCALWVFVIHSATARHPFIDLTLFQNRNYVLAISFIFVVGALLLGAAVVTAPMLQTVQGYPAVTAGLIMAPRGIGSMMAMMIAGRILDRIDPRNLVFLAAFLLIVSLFMMTGFDTDMGPQLIIWSGVIQGLGFGFGFVPLSTLAFATLPPHLRTEGASFNSLMRNFGGSVGVSIIATQIARDAQAHHARLAEQVNPFNPAFTDWLGPLRAADERTLALIDGEITRQAVMMSYLDSFSLMMVATILSLPLIMLLRPTRR